MYAQYLLWLHRWHTGENVLLSRHDSKDEADELANYLNNRLNDKDARYVAIVTKEIST